MRMDIKQRNFNKLESHQVSPSTEILTLFDITHKQGKSVCYSKFHYIYSRQKIGMYHFVNGLYYFQKNTTQNLLHLIFTQFL